MFLCLSPLSRGCPRGSEENASQAPPLGMTTCTFVGGALTCQEASRCLTFCNEWSLFVKWRNSGRFASFLSPSSSPLGVTVPSDSDGVLCHSACHGIMSVLSLPLVFQSRGEHLGAAWWKLPGPSGLLPVSWLHSVREPQSLALAASSSPVNLPQSRDRTVSHETRSASPFHPEAKCTLGQHRAWLCPWGTRPCLHT